MSSAWLGGTILSSSRISRHSLILRIYMENLCTLHQGFTPVDHLRIERKNGEQEPAFPVSFLMRRLSCGQTPWLSPESLGYGWCSYAVQLRRCFPVSTYHL